jgi:hypothetical protein
VTSRKKAYLELTRLGTRGSQIRINIAYSGQFVDVLEHR